MSNPSLNSAQGWQSFDLLLTCMVVADRAGRIEWVNIATQHLFERSRRSFQDLPLASLFEDKENFQKAFETVVSQRAISVTFTGTIAKLDDASLVSVSLHFDGNNDKLMVELHPIDQQTISDRNVRLAREIDIYQETFRNLAHEVKNPLGGIRGAAQLLEMELDNPAHREYTQVIVAEVGRLQQLVDRLIRPAQASLLLSSFNIHEVCERVCMLIGAEYKDKITIIRDYDASLPDIYADKEKLVQIYLNICRNAAQALLGAAKATVAPRHTEAEFELSGAPEAKLNQGEPTIILRTRVKTRQFLLDKVYKQVIVLSVIDNGPGIPTHIIDRVFHPLVTGRPDGTGLGLSLAQELARQQGGVIEFDSHPGRTEFRILLPMERT
ncbi:two-component system sensor histidine kinase NtrB [Pelistega europaea]|uniref:histidine kinase n=1 Tax=Pelistega europaea TaxID=106147 RepID=A0A7Y4L996_9BURK|nr:ATP-binding protein [Pelistega europaea]NOL49354.1 PAS domain-containing sensor histidine kinase [Pelistega europaea]